MATPPAGFAALNPGYGGSASAPSKQNAVSAPGVRMA
jgi:hypothetical protein